MTSLDRPTLILAIVLALFLWAYVRIAQEAPPARRLIRDVRVNVVNMKRGSLAYRLRPSEKIDLTIKGATDQVNNIEREDIDAQLDAGAITTTGNRKCPVKVTLPRGLVLVGKAPEVVVETTELSQRTFPVAVSFLSLPPAGTAIGEYLVQPALVTVQGTEDVLARVKYVTVAVDPTVPLTAGADFVPRPMNAEGERVVDASVLNASVRVRIASLTGHQMTREVAVRPPVLLNPPKHYIVTAVKVRPDVVIISGETTVIDRQSAYLETEPLDVRTVTRDTARTVHLRVPPDVLVVGPTDVRVDLQVQPTR